MASPETVQFFQFDSKGNLYVFPAGSGITGTPRLVKPGDEMVFNDDSQNLDMESTNDSGICIEESVHSSSNMQLPTASFAPSTQRGFNQPLDTDDLKKLSNKNFSPETMKKVNWAVKMYRDWRNYRHYHGFDHIECDLDSKSTITHANLIFALVRFITEVKNVDGKDFPPKTLYDILICIQFHLETMGIYWKLLNEQVFSDVRYTLDNLMKLRTEQGLGRSVKKAQILSSSDEELLWSLGLLGIQTPNQLLNTLVFVIGKGCALHAGKEYHKLRAQPFNSQFRFLKDDTGKTFLRYVEDIGMKTNKGGIKQRKLEPKEVDIFPMENKDRCPIEIIKFYLSVLPPNRNCSAFYLQPRKKYVPDIWFLDRPVGENRLRDTVKELCKEAKLPGFFSNHSLRSTATTKMYQCGLDEQLIQEVTGHRSVAVRSYKRTSQKQRKMAINCIFST